MVSPNYGQESPRIRQVRACLAPLAGGERVAASAVEKLPQHVVHWLTVLLGGCFARRRGRGGLGGRGVLGRRVPGRRPGGRGAGPGGFPGPPAAARPALA